MKSALPHPALLLALDPPAVGVTSRESAEVWLKAYKNAFPRAGKLTIVALSEEATIGDERLIAHLRSKAKEHFVLSVIREDGYWHLMCRAPSSDDELQRFTVRY